MFVRDFEVDIIVREYPILAFVIQDFKGVQHYEDDPVILSITTSGLKVSRLLVDGGSSSNVIY